MEFEFDKEIDFLLRQTARGETAFGDQIPDSRFQIPNSNHLDSDEISAFAENALPEKIRQNYFLHLADCERCRKSLANLIGLNAEATGEIVHVENPSAKIIAPKIPWYRQLFAVPNLAFMLGALILVFAGIGIFTVLQNDGLENSQLSQVSEKQTGGKGMSSDGDAVQPEVYSGNQMSSNTAAVSNLSFSNMSAANTMANASNTAASAANSNAAMPRRETGQTLKDAKGEDGSFSQSNRQIDANKPVIAAAPPPVKSSQDNFESDRAEEREQSNLSQNSETQNQAAQNQTQIMPDAKNVQRAPMPAAKTRSRSEDDDNQGETKLTAKKISPEPTNVGGKTFNRVNNIWTDSAYRGQATTNISRGTNEYKKLDSGLRGIVENLGGTVIVVWKGKNFRIQ